MDAWMDGWMDGQTGMLITWTMDLLSVFSFLGPGLQSHPVFKKLSGLLRMKYNYLP